MAYHSEAAKVRDLHIMKYVQGEIIDIGAGHDPITPNAYAIDGRPLPGISFVTDEVLTLSSQLVGCAHMPFDTVFSSHFLEHIAADYAALKDWSTLLKVGGHLVLYLPCGTKYDNKENLEHMRDITYDQFMFWFRRAFCGEGKDFRGNNVPKIFELVEHATDYGDDRYSFYVIGRKV